MYNCLYDEGIVRRNLEEIKLINANVDNCLKLVIEYIKKEYYFDDNYKKELLRSCKNCKSNNEKIKSLVYDLTTKII